MVSPQPFDYKATMIIICINNNSLQHGLVLIILYKDNVSIFTNAKAVVFIVKGKGLTAAKAACGKDWHYEPVVGLENDS